MVALKKKKDVYKKKEKKKSLHKRRETMDLEQGKRTRKKNTIRKRETQVFVWNLKKGGGISEG